MRLRIVTLFFLAALSCSATSIIIYVDAMGSGGPVDLLIDGLPAVGICINRDLPVVETWQADLLTISDIAANDQKAYLKAEWLNLQFATSADWIGIHHGIWNLFGSGFEDGLPWDALAEANYRSVDPKSFYILVATPRIVQTFIVLPGEEVPEPATYAMVLIGLILACAFHVRNRGNLRRRCQDR